VEALLANAGARPRQGLFSIRIFGDVRHVVDTNITGTIYLIQKVGREMRARGAGKILITGSIAGLMPGTYQASTTAPRRSSTPSPTRCGTS